MIYSNKKNLLLLLILFITVLFGVSMASASNNSNMTDSTNNTLTTSTTHNVISTSQVNNTVKEDTQKVNTNKTVNDKNDLENKTLKKDTKVTTWSDLVNHIKSSGTYTLKNNLIANTTLTTTSKTNATINGNGYKITFKNTGKIDITTDSTLNIANITLDGNNIVRTTSGITNKGTLTILNSTMKNFNSTSFGGVIYNSGVNSIFTNNTFTNNTAYFGGAIFNSASRNTTYNNNNFISNMAKSYYNAGGGAIYNEAGSNTKYINNNFINNLAKGDVFDYGGAIYEWKLINSTYTGNTFTSNTAYFGGATYRVYGENAIYTNNKFTKNIADTGGATYNEGCLKLTYTGNIFTKNTAKNSGAAIYNTNTTSTITGNSFNSNFVTNGESGETLILSGTKNILTNNNYFNNSIALANKVITRKVVGNNVLITAKISLANPTYYDSNILSKTNYTIYKNNVANKTQLGNSTFKITSFKAPYRVYETLSIAQSTYDNYKTNTIITKGQSTISCNNVTTKLGGIVSLNATVKDTSGNKINNGEAVVKINDKTFGRVNVNNGKISYKLNLTPEIFGKYNYKVTYVYGGNENYTGTRKNSVLTVTGFQPVITVKATNNTCIGDTIAITVNIKNTTGYTPNSGKVGIKINGQTYKINNKAVTIRPVNGVATFNIKVTSKMVGNNNVTVTYSGNSQFNEGRKTMTNVFTVQNKTRVTCTVNKVNGKLGQNVTLSAKFTTTNEKAIEEKRVVVKINDVTYGYTKIQNGVATFTQYLNPTIFGGYNYKITFKLGEGETYTGAANKNILTVTKYNTTIKYTKTTAKVGTTAKITVKITNKDATYSPNSGTVGLKINGKTYEKDGKAVTIKPVKGTATFNIPITANMKGNNNITFTYSGNSQFNSGRTTITNGLIVKT